MSTKPLSPSASLTRTMTRANRQQGFGLVELMVSMVLGLILIGGVLSIFLSNQQAFRTNEGLARVQENARISFELMAREIREAGGNPCGAKDVVNVVKDASTTWNLNWAGGSIIGTEGADDLTMVATGTAATERVAGTDAIQVMGASVGPSVRISTHTPASALITVAASTHNIGTNDFVLVCDGASAAITQATSVDEEDVYHLAGGATVPGNCVQGLHYNTTCAASVEKQFQPGGFVTELVSGVWYVGNNDRGGTSLFRRSAAGSDEIAEGVSDMQIDYLLRDEALGNLDSDWADASTIADWTSAAAKQVVAVRLNLTLQSTSSVGTDQAPLQRQLIHVVNLRNRSN